MKLLCSFATAMLICSGLLQAQSVSLIEHNQQIVSVQLGAPSGTWAGVLVDFWIDTGNTTENAEIYADYPWAKPPVTEPIAGYTHPDYSIGAGSSDIKVSPALLTSFLNEAKATTRTTMLPMYHPTSATNRTTAGPVNRLIDRNAYYWQNAASSSQAGMWKSAARPNSTTAFGLDVLIQSVLLKKIGESSARSFIESTRYKDLLASGGFVVRFQAVIAHACDPASHWNVGLDLGLPTLDLTPTCTSRVFELTAPLDFALYPMFGTGSQPQSSFRETNAGETGGGGSGNDFGDVILRVEAATFPVTLRLKRPVGGIVSVTGSWHAPGEVRFPLTWDAGSETLTAVDLTTPNYLLESHVLSLTFRMPASVVAP